MRKPLAAAASDKLGPVLDARDSIHILHSLPDPIRLPDPSGLLDGAGKALRHVKLRAVSDLGPAVVALVQAAIRCPRQPPV